MAEYQSRNPAASLARWEKQEHGKCRPGHHLHYRVRKSFWVEVRCKLCAHMEIEMYENSPLEAVA